MRIESFTEFKNGTIVPIVTQTGAKNWAFVPRKLTGEVPLSGAVWPTIANARSAVGSLEQIRGILPNPLLLLKPLQTRDAISSSAIEGTYTLPTDLMLFDLNKEEGEDSDVGPKRDAAREVWHHYEALRQGHNLMRDDHPIDQKLIAMLHSILMQGVKGYDKAPGEFRKSQVAVGVRPRRYIPPPADFVQECMNDLDSYIASTVECDPLVKSFIVHYQFEAIHPFPDGNGRVGRVLLSLCISRWCKLSMPWLYLSDFFQRNRSEYIQRLFAVSANGEWDEWIEFCCQGTIEQAEESVQRCTMLHKIREQYYSLFDQPVSRKIIDMIFQRPLITTARVARACNVTHQTARKHLKALADEGVLQESANTRPKYFVSPEIVNAAFGQEIIVGEPAGRELDVDKSR
ncbi:MAG: Fic family protein [Phycisphaerae bacterium]